MSPGAYRLTIDPASIPPNYTCLKTTFELHVAPNSTAVQDVPLQALRSISGQILLRMTPDTMGAKAGGPGPAPRPVAGARITLASRVAITDDEGRFALRNLPAGSWVLEVVALSPVPEGVKMPSGQVDLPRGPIQVQGATIVISNPVLLKYLVPAGGETPSPAGGSR